MKEDIWKIEAQLKSLKDANAAENYKIQANIDANGGHWKLRRYLSFPKKLHVSNRSD